MAGQKIIRALISTYDKAGVVALARRLTGLGIEIISTGGTAETLTNQDIKVTAVEQITAFPEMLDGRVKTLHPKIHGGILADRHKTTHLEQMNKHDIAAIDMVVCNLYPFGKTIRQPDCTLEQAIEMIDIGGPSMVRAAAKNHAHVVVMTDPSEYDVVCSQLKRDGVVDDVTRRALAGKAFQHCADYDQAVASYLGQNNTRPGMDAKQSLGSMRLRRQLRYGENPHQTAAAYTLNDSSITEVGLIGASPISAVDISYNNYVDADAALALCGDLHRSFLGDAVSVFIKHNNACGAACDQNPIEAYRNAYLGDPHAAMGGVLAQNHNVDVAMAEAVMESLDRWGRAAGAGAFFVEVWVAPSFEPEALEVIKSRKQWGQRVRTLAVGAYLEHASIQQFRSVDGGLLVQQADHLATQLDDWTVASRRQPTEDQWADLRFAWLVCKHTRSNAISVCAQRMLLGNGAGQMSRVMSCRLATWLATENGHAQNLEQSVAASDAFFPFADGPKQLIGEGVQAIIQPGGSKRDQDTIDLCNEGNAAMVFTKTRHFKH